MVAKRIGRPPLPDDQRKTKIIPFRCREDLYEQLVKAAAEGRRTLSQELELRVSDSFTDTPEAPEPRVPSDADRIKEAFAAIDRFKDLTAALSEQLLELRVLDAFPKKPKEDRS